MRKTACLFVVLILLNCTACPGFAQNNQLPSGLPPGLNAEIKGHYRIIEHSANMDAWTAYDVRGWKKSGDGIVMNPPIYRYEHEGNGRWSTYLHDIPITNTFREELVTIVRAKQNRQQSQGQASSIDNLPAIPLDSKQAYYKLLQAITPMTGNNVNAPPDERARFFYTYYVNNYRRAGYSFEKSVTSWAKAYNRSPHFHTETKYANTPARPMYGDVHMFSDSLDDFPFKKFFSKEAYEALITVKKIDERLKGKRIE